MVVHNTKDTILHGLLCCLLLSKVLRPIAACEIQLDEDAAIDQIEKRIDRELKQYVDETFSKDKFIIADGIKIDSVSDSVITEKCGENGRSVVTSFDDYFWKKFQKFIRTHVVTVELPRVARFFRLSGKSAFLTGFGLGFLAFGFKKMLLPMLIGSLIVKSGLFAMFLPSILGTLGKLAAKSLSHATTLSGSSGQPPAPPIDDFDFKDTGAPYNADGTDDYTVLAAPEYTFQMQTGNTANVNNNNAAKQQAMSRFGNEPYQNQRVTYVQPQSDNYYFRRPTKQHDYKVFHKIPSSSLLLTTYDPFYSPLLSRLDSVFVQLGLGDGKGQQMEKCRERLVCLMYANPAKYAPYSNLVSAQLSRELNELRKPSSDNPEILRFFRYMRAAKDGQDGASCQTHSGCPSLQPDKPSPAMLTTFNDINKLVQARKLH